MRPVQKILIYFSLIIFLLVLYSAAKNKSGQLIQEKSFDCIPLLFLRSGPEFNTFIESYKDQYSSIIEVLHSQLEGCFEENGIKLITQEIYVLSADHRFYEISSGYLSTRERKDVPLEILQSFSAAGSCPIRVHAKSIDGDTPSSNTIYKPIFKAENWSIYAYVAYVNTHPMHF